MTLIHNSTSRRTPRPSANIYDAYVRTGHVTMIFCDEVRHYLSTLHSEEVYDHDSSFTPNTANFPVRSKSCEVSQTRTLDLLTDVT